MAGPVETKAARPIRRTTLAATLALAAIALAVAASAALAVPMRDVVYSVEGVVKEASWHPRELVKVDPKEAMFPCSPRGDYYKPAYYQVVLTGARRMNGHWEPGWPVRDKWFDLEGDVSLHLRHPADDLGLKPGVRLGVYRYTERGDECGRWFTFRSLKVLDRDAADGGPKQPARTQASD